MEKILLENAVADWLYAVTIVAALLVVMTLLKWAAIHRLSVLAERTTTKIDNSLVEAARATRLWLLFFPALFIASNSLVLAPVLMTTLQVAASVALLLQSGLWLTRVLEFWVSLSRQRALASDAAATTTSLAVLTFVGRLVVWAVILLMALSNFGVDITALIAGLGIGGIAVALALQNVLGDLFASLSIVMDKPFAIGDFIIVDDLMGTVEHVGLKTTRIRSLGGEQIVISNADLLKTRVRNFKRMRERRIVFAFGVLYQTPPELLERIPATVRDIIEKQEGIRFDRAHFKEFGASSYDFEVVYWMLNPDYNLYMDAQQAINLELVRAFERDGIGFAYPTRTLFIEGGSVPVVIAQNPTGA